MDAMSGNSAAALDSNAGLWTRLVRGCARIRINPTDTHRFPQVIRRDLMHIETPDRFHAKQGRSTARCAVGAGPARLSVYLKRQNRFGWLRRCAATLWPGRDWTPASREWRNLWQAIEAGIPVPRPVAMGEFIGPRGQLAGFLMVAELVGHGAMHEHLPHAAAVLTPEQFRRHKRALVAEMARITARLHSARLFHKDLYLCHFFCPAEAIHDGLPVAGRVSLIDLHRLGRHPLLAVRWQFKDLAEWFYSSEIPLLTERDRLWFFKCYLGVAKLTWWQKWCWRVLRFKAAWYGRHNRRMTVGGTAPDQPLGRQEAQAA
jgi:heptose I phosphotransferase